MPLHISVIVAGIVDPKWPASALLPVVVGQDSAQVGRPAHAALINCELSPFDKAALECALQLRDAGDEVTITVIVASGTTASVEGLMRTVAGYRPDHLLGREISVAELWDAQATASRLATALDDAPAAPDFVLIGREFGDYDDGAVAPCLGETLAWPFVGLIHEIRRQQSACTFVRQRGDIEEHFATAGPVVASVTNAPCNRLRHPLLKNVMAAKRARFAAARCGAPLAATSRELIAVSPAVATSRRTTPCRLIGGSTEQQAAALADYLLRLGVA